jgi:hypothetical protein
MRGKGVCGVYMSESFGLTLEVFFYVIAYYWGEAGGTDESGHALTLENPIFAQKVPHYCNIISSNIFY